MKIKGCKYQLKAISVSILSSKIAIIKNIIPLIRIKNEPTKDA